MVTAVEVFRLDYLNESYIKKIVDIEKMCFSCPNSEKLIASDIANENADVFVAVDEGGTLCGYVGLHFVLDEGYMDNLAVDKDYRRRGVASALLNALNDFAKEKELSFITLEVRESNLSAQALYDKSGYIQVGKRKRFYCNPTEDAILMTKYYKRTKL